MLAASGLVTFGMTGYALGPTVYILLLGFFFQQQWLADAESRGLSVQQAETAVNAVRSSLANSPGTTGYDPNSSSGRRNWHWTTQPACGSRCWSSHSCRWLWQYWRTFSCRGGHGRRRSRR
ncbi:hypothetical protein ACVGVM_12155 [Pseudonocardia bannensis]|uniref:hypothetical protein n=1 Tax=Pseudonocardia bannensis TaxID=630973 RepID=UPI001B7CDFB6|nr:hypothetical protein [Pseudonocardia bannensis]